MLLLNVRLPIPKALAVLTLRSVSAIPLPPDAVRSVLGAHSVPLHLSTCPVVGDVVLTSVNPLRVVAPPPPPV